MRRPLGGAFWLPQQQTLGYQKTACDQKRKVTESWRPLLTGSKGERNSSQTIKCFLGPSQNKIFVLIALVLPEKFRGEGSFPSAFVSALFLVLYVPLFWLWLIFVKGSFWQDSRSLNGPLLTNAGPVHVHKGRPSLRELAVELAAKISTAASVGLLLL